MRICLKCTKPLPGTKWHCLDCGWMPEFQGEFPLLAPDLASGFPDYPPEAHGRRVHLEDHHFWFRYRNRIITSFLKRYFSQAHTFFEIGCGTGYVLSGISRAFPGLKLFGAEAYPSALAYAKARTRGAEYAQMDAYRLPFFEEFDVIGAFDVLEHLSNDGAALKEMYRTVKPGGGLMLTVPQHSWLWSALDSAAGHKRRYSRKEIEHKVQSAGFKVLFMTSFVTLLLPFMVISRWAKARRFKGDRSKMQSEVNLPLALNSLFKFICSWETVMIRKKISLPIGGSLLCVARKGTGE